MAKKSKGPILTGLSKPIPEMPEGYYSGDKPNPNLRSFVEAHLKEHPYDPEDDEYAVPAFDRPLKATKATTIYNMHTYWSKKPHAAIREYVRHYTEEGELVVDPFSGSGGTALAALSEGRKAIAIDRSPAAAFITKNYCTPLDPEELRRVFESIKAELEPMMAELYGTRCDRCGGKATTAYTVYSQVFQCSRCLQQVPLFDCVDVEDTTSAGKPKTINACPHCYRNGVVEGITTRQEKLGAIPVLVRYICESGCRPARSERRHDEADRKKRDYFKRYDAAKITELDAQDVPYPVPPHRMMNSEEGTERWALLWRPYLGDRAYVRDFFRKRNQWALAAILDAINSRQEDESLVDALRFTFSSCLLNASDMYRYRASGKGGISMGTLYVGPLFQVMNAWRVFEDKFRSVMRGYQDIAIQTGELCISCQSATDLPQIVGNSVDFIFTDPPYSWKVQYGECNFIWESWLGLDTAWHEDEVIVNENRGIAVADWMMMMRDAMSECFRILKPGRWLSLCYHDSAEGTWATIQDIMQEVGFIPEDGSRAVYVDTDQKSWKQQVADKVTKRDLVINFRKPKPNEGLTAVVLTGDEDDTTFLEKVRDVVRAFLQANPGSTKDRVYDEVVSRLVRRGRMEAFQFDRVLEELAEPIEGRVMENLFEAKRPDLLRTHVVNKWYLKDAVDRVDEAESLREDAAADRLERFMREYLRTNPEKQGVHYSDLFEQVVMLSERPRRDMADWLWDYFIKTDEGTWRPPATEEEREEKRRQRATGAIRKIKSFAKALDLGDEIPKRLRPDSDRTLADWIRQARRAGLYQQGRSLFEKGGLNLSRLEEADENLAMDVNEDYRYCLKQLSDGKGI